MVHTMYRVLIVLNLCKSCFISAFPVDDNGNCPDLQCDNMCLFGTVQDDSGCPTCRCLGAGT